MPRLCLPVYVRFRAKLWFQRCVQNRYAVLLSTWVDGGFEGGVGGGVGGVADVRECWGGVADLDT